MPHVDLPQAEFKVVLLGDTFTGKTSLVLRFAEGYYRESARSATVGAFFITKRITVPSVGLTCKIQIWDTAGQEQFKPLAPMYYSNAAAAILCYDPASKKSLDTLQYWLEELHRNVPAGRIVIAMAACKCDLLKESCTAETQQRLQQVEDMASQMGAIFVPTSAKNNDNVTELFSMVAERVLQFQKQKGDKMPVTMGGGTAYTNSPENDNSTPVGLVPRPDSTLPHHQQKAKSTSALPYYHNNNGNNHSPTQNNNHYAHYQDNTRPSSPHSVSTMNREDYLHRRSHHVEEDDHGSPPRRPNTDPSRMEGSPILTGSPKDNKTPGQGSSVPNFAVCGDTDYLNTCVAIPGAAQLASSMEQTGRCVIL